MSSQTNISWCDSTFNPWLGCTKVSPACDHCYAERLMDHRMHKVQWGVGQPRKRTSAANWRLPLRWNGKSFMQCEDCGWRGEADAAVVGCGACGSIELSNTRRRVFCASLADVFDNEAPIEWLVDLLDLIRTTPHLDWLLLTKRIGNVAKMIEAPGMQKCGVPPNVWLGATICNQQEADRDIPKLLAVPAAKRFLSIEPMLGAVDLSRPLQLGRCKSVGPARERFRCGLPVDHDGDHTALIETGAPWFGITATLHWVICGGESGPHARPMHPDWVRSLRDQCAAAGVAFHFKQWGEYLLDESTAGTVPVPGPFEHKGTFRRLGTKAAGRLLDGVEHNGFPA